jgi:hypothetical protein
LENASRSLVTVVPYGGSTFEITEDGHGYHETLAKIREWLGPGKERSRD